MTLAVRLLWVGADNRGDMENVMSIYHIFCIDLFQVYLELIMEKSNVLYLHIYNMENCEHVVGLDQ